MLISLLFPLSLQLETTSDILRRNYLRLRLYAKRLGFDSPSFRGESWVPFFKIYDDVIDSRTQEENNYFCDSYFTEKLWFEGKCMGFIEGVVVLQNTPIVKQMMAGVHTSQGIMRISPPILGEFLWEGRKSLSFIRKNAVL